MCLQRVFKEHTGLNWRKRKRGTKFELTQLSMWSKLGINVRQYVAWYRSPHEAQFGIIQKYIQCCTECDGVGDDVRCLRQNNMWRCVSRQTSHSWPHRQPFDPLDVNAAWAAEDRQEERKQPEGEDADEKDQEEHAPSEHTTHNKLIDRLLGHIGFTDGTALGKPGVSRATMTVVWSTADVSEQDRAAVLVRYGVDLGSVITNRKDMKNLLLQFGIVLQIAGLQIQAGRYRGTGERQRMMYVVAL